jgi:uncharacterized membrane protein
MKTPASIFGHPIHPMIVPIPIGLFLFSYVADLAARFNVIGDAWPDVAFYCMAGGIVGALAAALFGLIDLLSLHERRAKRIGIVHMLINLGVVALYAGNLLLRWQPHASPDTPFVLSTIAILALVVSGWLGGHMVYVHGVAVGEPGTVERRHASVPVRDERRISSRSPIRQY